LQAIDDSRSPPSQSQERVAAGVVPPPVVAAGTSTLATLGVAMAYERDVKRRRLDSVPTATTADEAAAFIYMTEIAIDQSGTCTYT
jgi:hypothetical protein